MKKTMLLLCIVMAYSACKIPNMLVSEDLKSAASVFDVKGKQGWNFNQDIKFGDYSTSKIKRGWVKGSETNFFIRFQKAEQKMSFVQNTPDNVSADILAVGSFKNNEIDLLKGFLALPIAYESSFAGTVIPNDNSKNPWEFIIHNPDASLPKNVDCGVARDKSGRELQIKAVKKVEGQGNWSKIDNYGFEFFENGKSIGAISNINRGKVWIKNDISPDLKLIVSSLATSLLIRSNLSETFTR